MSQIFVSKTVFVVGLIVAILASSGISAIVSTQWARGPQGPKGDTGATGPLEVVAAGVVRPNGTMTTGYNITSVTLDTTWNYYIIHITGIFYYILDYITLVTPGGSAYSAVATSGGGDLFVYLYDQNGVLVQDYFQFVTYRIRP